MSRSLQLLSSARFLPEGENENSPGWSAAEPWVYDATTRPSRRAGRNSPPHVARIVFNAMFFEERDELRLEVPFSMVFLLPGNVGQRRLNLRPSDGKRPIALLPFENVHRTGVVHPEGRRALDLAHGVGDCHCRRNRQQHMHVVFGPSDSKGLQIMFPRHAAHKGPQTRLNFRRNRLAAFLRGKDTVIQRATIGM